jgi:hypothetical protein
MTGLVIVLAGWPLAFAGQLALDRAFGWPLARGLGAEVGDNSNV